MPRGRLAAHRTVARREAGAGRRATRVRASIALSSIIPLLFLYSWPFRSQRTDAPGRRLAQEPPRLVFPPVDLLPRPDDDPRASRGMWPSGPSADLGGLELFAPKRKEVGFPLVLPEGGAVLGESFSSSALMARVSSGKEGAKRLSPRRSGLGIGWSLPEANSRSAIFSFGLTTSTPSSLAVANARETYPRNTHNACSTGRPDLVLPFGKWLTASSTYRSMRFLAASPRGLV